MAQLWKVKLGDCGCGCKGAGDCGPKVGGLGQTAPASSSNNAGLYLLGGTLAAWALLAALTRGDRS